MPKLLGILGGMGPMSTVYFYELLTRRTPAARDQDHIDIVISSRASTPDRTAFILGESADDPGEALAADARRLAAFGADALCIPCNTAHFFYDRVQAAVSVPIFNMVELTVLEAKARGVKRVGLLATAGTVAAGVYQSACERHGLVCAVPDAAGQAALMRVIYGDVKRGRRADMDAFAQAVGCVRRQGCELAVLGCTELSLVGRDGQLGDFYLDALQALADEILREFGVR